MFYVLLGADYWPTSHYEPLLVGLSFPLYAHSPWHPRGTPLLVNASRELSSVPLLDFQWGGGAYSVPTSLTNEATGNHVRKHGAEGATRHLMTTCSGSPNPKMKMALLWL
jgi:hypothetical protein